MVDNQVSDKSNETNKAVISTNQAPKKNNSYIVRMVTSAAGLAPHGKTKPIFPDNSLSIIERVFHRTPVEKPQVSL